MIRRKYISDYAIDAVALSLALDPELSGCGGTDYDPVAPVPYRVTCRWDAGEIRDCAVCRGELYGVRRANRVWKCGYDVIRLNKLDAVDSMSASFGYRGFVYVPASSTKPRADLILQVTAMLQLMQAAYLQHLNVLSSNIATWRLHTESLGLPESMPVHLTTQTNLTALVHDSEQ